MISNPDLVSKNSHHNIPSKSILIKKPTITKFYPKISKFCMKISNSDPFILSGFYTRMSNPKPFLYYKKRVAFGSFGSDAFTVVHPKKMCTSLPASLTEEPFTFTEPFRRNVLHNPIFNLFHNILSKSHLYPHRSYTSYNTSWLPHIYDVYDDDL